jgi:hypothetical protein
VATFGGHDGDHFAPRSDQTLRFAPRRFYEGSVLSEVERISEIGEREGRLRQLANPWTVHRVTVCRSK